MRAALDYIDHEAAKSLLTPADAVEALRRTLRAGYRPETDHARITNPLAHGEFLLIPSETGFAVGSRC